MVGTLIKLPGLVLSDIRGIASIDTEGYNVLQETQENNELYINAFGSENNLNTQASPLLNISNLESYPNFFIAKRGIRSKVARAVEFINALEDSGASVRQVDGSIYDHEGIETHLIIYVLFS